MARIDVALRPLFAAAFAWALGFNLVAVSSLFTDRWGERFRSLLDGCAVLISIGLGIALTWVMVRRWPGFLRTNGTAWGSLAMRLVASLLVSAVAIAILSAVFEAIELRLFGDPTNPQYGVSIFMEAIWYPFMLSPLLAVLVTWWWGKRGTCAAPAFRE